MPRPSCLSFVSLFFLRAFAPSRENFFIFFLSFFLRSRGKMCSASAENLKISNFFLSLYSQTLKLILPLKNITFFDKTAQVGPIIKRRLNLWFTWLFEMVCSILDIQLHYTLSAARYTFYAKQTQFSPILLQKQGFWKKTNPIKANPPKQTLLEKWVICVCFVF